MRAVFLFSLLLSKVAMTPAFVQTAVMRAPSGDARAEKAFRGVVSAQQRKSQEEVEPWAVRASAQKRGGDAPQMTTDERDSQVGRERLAAQAKALHLFALRQGSLWSEKNKKDKFFGIVGMAHAAATCGYGSNADRVLLVLKPLLKLLAGRSLVALKTRTEAAGLTPIRDTMSLVSRIPGVARPERTVDTSPAQPHGNSRGWFGWRAAPPSVSSQGSDIVVSRASQQGASAWRQEYELLPQQDEVVAGCAAGDLWRKGDDLVWRADGALPKTHNTPFLGGARSHVRDFSFTHWSSR